MTKGKGYLLPAVINPARRRCIPVYVPDHPDHIRAFLGQLDMLSYWWTWARDEARTAAAVARVWRGVVEQVRETLDAGEGCGGVSDFDVRQDPDQPCRLEKTTNNGVSWTPWADLRLCRPDLPALVTGGEILVPFDGELIPITDLPPGTDTVTTSDERRPAGDDEELAKCLAAVNAALVFRRLHEEAWRIQLSGGLTPGNILVAGVLALAGIGLLAPTLIVWGPASAVMTWLLYGTNTGLTSEVERQFACILKNRAYINAGEVYFDWALVKSDVESRINNINIWLFIAGYLDVIGANGLNKAGAVTAITECCDPCASGTAQYDIDLRTEAGRDVLVPFATFTDSEWSWTNGTGWRLASPNTAQGACRFTLPVRPGSQIANVFVRLQTSHEPYNWSMTVGSVQRVESGYRAFGNFYHGLLTPLNIYAGTLSVIFFVNVNPVINTAATFTHLRIEYRGCPPL
jgi:hypothetical protein